MLISGSELVGCLGRIGSCSLAGEGVLLGLRAEASKACARPSL